MNIAILILLIIVACGLIIVGAYFVLGPEKIINSLMRFNFFKTKFEKKALAEIKNNPDALIDAARQHGGEDMAKALEKQLKGKTEKEREDLLNQAMALSQNPQGSITPPRKTSSTKKTKARANRKASRSQAQKRRKK